MDTGHLEIRLKPRAKNDRVVVTGTCSVDVAVTSPPVEEKANEHLIKLLSKKLGVPKSFVSLVRGGHSKSKAVAVEGLSTEEAMKRLAIVD